MPTLLHMNNSNIFINILILSVFISFLSFRTFYPGLGFYIFFHIFPFFSLLFLSFPLSFFFFLSFFLTSSLFFPFFLVPFWGSKKFLGPLVPWSAIFSCLGIQVSQRNNCRILGLLDWRGTAVSDRRCTSYLKTNKTFQFLFISKKIIFVLMSKLSCPPPHKGIYIYCSCKNRTSLP